MKFTSSSAGQITALKFYRSASDTGTDLVDLWSSTGTKLASATFTNTTATGWQTVNLAQPVPISANTTYVASYHTNGAYVATDNFFTSAVTSGQLTAPSSASVSGGNGVYSFGGTSTTGIFPTSTWNASNYYADVVFTSSTGGTDRPPVAVNDSGFTTTQNTALNILGSTLLANDSDPDGDPLTITGVSGGLNGTASFNAQNNTATFTPTTGYTGPASFTYAISDGRGGTASASVSLTVNPATDRPPVAVNDSGFTTTQNTALNILGSALLANDSDPDGDPLTITGVSGGLNGTASFNAQNNTATFTPTTGYTGPASFTYAISDGRGGTASASVSLTVNPATDRPPVAVNDSGFTTTQNTALNILGSTLLANDSDPDGDPLTITGVSGGVNGTASFNAQNNTATFTPTTGYTGPASFTYAISDGRGGTASASVSLTVKFLRLSRPPVAVNDERFHLHARSPRSISRARRCSPVKRPGQRPLTITGASGGVNGAASQRPDHTSPLSRQRRLHRTGFFTNAVTRVPAAPPAHRSRLP